MPTRSPSAALRRRLRERIVQRIDELGLSRAEAAAELGLSAAQLSRLAGGQDIFSLDRLVDAAEHVGLSVRMIATRPYGGD